MLGGQVLAGESACRARSGIETSSAAAIFLTVPQGWVRVSALDGRNGAGRHAGRVGQVLLAEAALVAELTDRVAEGRLRVWLASHSQLQTADS